MTPGSRGWSWLVLATLVLVAGCKSMTSKPLLQVRGPEQVLAEAPPTERTFVWASGGAEFLDPALVSESAGHHLMLNCFVGAYQYNRGDGPPVPALASHHEVTPDGLTWTIHLRPGIVWSDGKAIEAEDFVWSWRRVLAPQTASRAAQLLWFVAGAKAYNEGSDPDPAHVGVRALDSRTLQVQLAEPVAFFDHLLAEMPYAPTPRHVVEKFGTAWTEPDHIVVSGPFTLSHYESRKRAELKKNPKFIDAAEVWLDKVVVLDTESERTALDWYEVGRTHWLGDVSLPMDQVPALRTAGRPDFRTEKKLCSYYFSNPSPTTRCPTCFARHTATSRPKGWATTQRGAGNSWQTPAIHKVLVCRPLSSCTTPVRATGSLLNLSNAAGRKTWVFALNCSTWSGAPCSRPCKPATLPLAVVPGARTIQIP
jgi:ABC-type oligopeptide transport system substrate-binding subunit